jgi:hypothetical protein
MMNEYINTYVEIILEYINEMDKSEFMSAQLNRDFLVYTGFRAITHIFQISYTNSNDLNTAFYNSRNAYIFYLEYLEQINKTNMRHDLCHTDAIKFLYSKTISQMSPNSTPDNLAIVSKLTELILWFDNTHIDQTKMTQKTLMSLLQFDSDMLLYYLETSQLRTMSDAEYKVFLSDTCSLLKKNTNQNVDWNMQRIYKMRDLNDNINMPIQQWGKWLASHH